MNATKILITTVAVIGTLASQFSVAADTPRTTGVTMSTGQRILVHTDRKGTLVTEYPSRRSVYSSGGDRHNEAVKAWSANGGRVGKTVNR